MDGDYSTFHVNVGRQYPVKLKTKIEEIKLQARAAGKNKAVWTFEESEGNPNPHRPGTFYKNRWLSRVEEGGTLDPSMAGQQQLNVGGKGAAGGRTDAERVSIERQTIVKAMMPLLGMFPNREEFWEFVAETEKFMQLGLQGEKPEAAPPTQTFVPTADPSESADPDNDIPF